MLLECMDVMLGHVPVMSARVSVAQLLLDKWSLTESNLAVLVSRRPDLVPSSVAVCAGRGRLAVVAGPAIHAGSASFAHTRHALCMLERVAVCVAQRESVLLVGETGNGKTSVVQVCRSRRAGAGCYCSKADDPRACRPWRPCAT